MPRPRAVLIAGPTASGKSALALDLATRLGGVVVNADSMQVYRELRVLTARPTAEEEARAPHRLYGHVPAAENHSVGRWLAAAEAVVAEAGERGATPIFVGGTGLYFKALLEGLSPVPDIPAAVRARWRQAAAALSGPELHRLLAERDAEMAARLRPSDTQRVARALEVLDATGRSLARWQEAAGRGLFDARAVAKLVLAPERAPLAARIDARFEAMLAAGALEEVAALAARGLDPALPAMRAHGVRPLLAHLRGGLGLDAAAERVKAETRQYAKRQLTWARRFMVDWDWTGSHAAALERVAATPA